MTDPNQEMLSLLREIRDLQQKHFDRYLEFTTQALDGQRQSVEVQRRDAERAADDSAAALEEQSRISQSVRQSQWLSTLLAVILVAILFLFLSGSFLSQFLISMR